MRREETQEMLAEMRLMYPEITSTTTDTFVTAIVKEVTDQAMALGIDPDPDELLTESARWARDYSYGLITKLEATDQKLTQQVMTQLTNREIDKATAQGLLERAFSPVRARMIAATELTRAYHQATLAYEEQLGKYGLETQVRWITAADERVCPLCGPMDNLLDDDWKSKYPNGPPIHPRCRCATSIERVTPGAERIPGVFTAAGGAPA